MLKVTLGLIASTAFYAAAIYGFVWSAERRIDWAAKNGIALGPEPRFPSLGEIWRRHSVEVTILYSLFFAALALIDLPIWQRIGTAAVLAVIYGSFWIAKSPEKLRLPAASKFRQVTGAVGYWLLAVIDWFAYLGVLCFATALIVELL